MEADGISPGEDVLTNALSACASSAADGGHDAAVLWDRLLAAATAAGSDGGSGHPSPRAFKAALAVAARTADTDRAAALLEMMRDRDLAPDEVAISFAVRASASAGRWRGAISLLELIYAAPAPAAAPPTSTSDPATAAAAASASDALDTRLLDSQSTLTLVLSPAISLATRATIAACGRAGEWEQGLTVLDRTLAHAGKVGATLDPSLAPSLYGAALEGCCAGGAWHRGLDCLRGMEARGVAADVGCYNAVLSACHAAAQWEEVYNLLYEMRAAGLTGPESLRPFHKGMWKQARKQLGLDLQPTADRRAKLKKAQGFQSKQKLGKGTRKWSTKVAKLSAGQPKAPKAKLSRGIQASRYT